MTDAEFPTWMATLPIGQVLRVDLGLEGAWSETVVCVWDRDSGVHPVPEDFPRQSSFRPAVELYMPGGWIGVHCSVDVGELFALDEERLRVIVLRVAEVA